MGGGIALAGKGNQHRFWVGGRQHLLWVEFRVCVDL